MPHAARRPWTAIHGVVNRPHACMVGHAQGGIRMAQRTLSTAETLAAEGRLLHASGRRTDYGWLARVHSALAALLGPQQPTLVGDIGFDELAPRNRDLLPQTSRHERTLCHHPICGMSVRI